MSSNEAMPILRTSASAGAERPERGAPALLFLVPSSLHFNLRVAWRLSAYSPRTYRSKCRTSFIASILDFLETRVESG